MGLIHPPQRREIERLVLLLVELRVATVPNCLCVWRRLHSMSSWGTHLGVPSSFSPMLFQKIRIFGRPFCAQILQKELLLVLFSLFSTRNHLFATVAILTFQISSFLIKMPSSLSSTTTLAG